MKSEVPPGHETAELLIAKGEELLSRAHEVAHRIERRVRQAVGAHGQQGPHDPDGLGGKER
jgi:hypothetical protein